MKIKIITIFPEFFDSPLQVSIPARAIEKGLVEIVRYDLRDYATNKHRKTDDEPFGGGPGMVMKPEPWFNAIPTISTPGTPVIFLTPQGERLTQSRIADFAAKDEITLLCGRYKGMDERVRETLVTDEISVGDYVLSGGEPAALILLDSIVRLIPGVLSDYESAEKDSFSTGLLDHPHYTRPADLNGRFVPEILLSGHHLNIEKWRRQQSLKRTWQRRPDLLQHVNLSQDDRRYLDELENDVSEA